MFKIENTSMVLLTDDQRTVTLRSDYYNADFRPINLIERVWLDDMTPLLATGVKLMFAYSVLIRGPVLRKDGKDSLVKRASRNYQNNHAGFDDTLENIPSKFLPLLKGQQVLVDELNDIFMKVVR